MLSRVPTLSPARARLGPALRLLASARAAFPRRARLAGLICALAVGVVATLAVAVAAGGGRPWAAPWLLLEMVPNPDATLPQPEPQVAGSAPSNSPWPR